MLTLTFKITKKIIHSFNKLYIVPLYKQKFILLVHINISCQFHAFDT